MIYEFVFLYLPEGSAINVPSWILKEAISAFGRPEYDTYWIKIHCVEPHSKIVIKWRSVLFCNRLSMSTLIPSYTFTFLGVIRVSSKYWIFIRFTIYRYAKHIDEKIEFYNISNYWKWEILHLLGFRSGQLQSQQFVYFNF